MMKRTLEENGLNGDETRSRLERSFKPNDYRVREEERVLSRYGPVGTVPRPGIAK
jgi:hypothetical protein